MASKWTAVYCGGRLGHKIFLASVSFVIFSSFFVLVGCFFSVFFPDEHPEVMSYLFEVFLTERVSCSRTSHRSAS